jgi:molybdopterin-guanine dinucleotide biosynthesis adapter protein
MAKQTEQVRLDVEQRGSQSPMTLQSSRLGGLPDSAVEPTSSGMGKAPAVVAFVGRSGSGKTTLLLKLIPALRARQIRVAMVKHSSHRGIETDVAGSDSRRFWDAGADEVALVTPDRLTHTRRVAGELRLDRVLSVVGSVDLILLEGFKRSDVSKIEVIRTACTPVPLEELRGRVACVTDVADLGTDCPVFGLDDVAGVVDFLMKHVAALD